MLSSKMQNYQVVNLFGKLANPMGEIIYTPPEGEAVIRNKFSNLESFLYVEDDLDPLIKLAVMHYQFEAIRLFTDGNGRTGRIVNILYLIEEGLIDLSAGRKG